MRSRTLAGLAVAGFSAAAVAGGAAYAANGTEGEPEPTVRIVQEAQPGEDRDCPGEGAPTAATTEAGL
ncbi:hypothetical protein B0I33_103207 [Prauserella shujinwangii]|uniref:Uncharacterized protein n=1 Tax=Prauserella shujinwangii TaxID=1453103 RepID=A0A2T0LYJ1_9PSEU|nr:hypothetical protein [Prauserella shujinwangii]PRX49174.1 hypothetical protein B0I33_103207 [Prauserella shujinwangii]